MTLENFETLAIEKQQKALLTLGVFLAERRDAPLRMMLYDMGGYYVEVFFLGRSNKVAWFNGFETLEKLDPYLSVIDLSAVLEEAHSK